ncbi:hypothetical protein D3C73_1209300 [compost metagenome]
MEHITERGLLLKSFSPASIILPSKSMPTTSLNGVLTGQPSLQKGLLHCRHLLASSNTKFDINTPLFSFDCLNIILKYFLININTKYIFNKEHPEGYSLLKF